MDRYECEDCGNTWPDYEPKACPFCFSQQIYPLGIGIPEEEPAEIILSDTESN